MTTGAEKREVCGGTAAGQETGRREERIFRDLGNECTPALHISPLRERYKWNSVPYETWEGSGTMLVSLGAGRPQNVTLEPQLTGWYRIYVGLGAFFGSCFSGLNLRLGSEDTAMHLSPSHQEPAPRQIEEAYWRCADMTGESVVIGKDGSGNPTDVMLAWIRFVPMEEDEVKAFLADCARTDTKRLYATNDMYIMLFQYDSGTPEAWRTLVRDYLQSDVEWLSLEDIRYFDGDTSTGNRDNFAYLSEVYQETDRRIRQDFTPEMLADLMRYGHEQGLKMCISARMGAWGIEFPLDQMHYDNVFMEEHRNLRCVDRDGTPIDALSYIWPEVQEYVIGLFVQMAGLGCDAVEMLFHRGVPYVLFEQPFVDLYMERYGEDPRELPLDDERLTSLRCEVMTEFVRKLKVRLDETVGKGKIGLHARVQFSLWDCRHVALDVEAWAKEGLITAILSYPQRIREKLPENVWREDAPGRIDLAKYKEAVRECPQTIIHRQQDFCFLPPEPDSKGIPRGPVSQKERVEEFMALERAYGVPVYFEIMPREMTPEEYRDRALELYDLGAEHIGLWDCYQRAYRKMSWSMVRRLGHKEELHSYDSGEGEYYRYVRVLKIGNRDISRYMPMWGG